MDAAPDIPTIRTALRSEVLRAFVRGWCRGEMPRQKVVVYFLLAVTEEMPSSVRDVAHVTGVDAGQVSRILSAFREAISSAQAEEERLGLPLNAWASSLLRPGGEEPNA